jgi:hypothetical protein
VLAELMKPGVNGVYVSARELAETLHYSWQRLDNLLRLAMEACQQAGTIDYSQDFKKVEIQRPVGSHGGQRMIEDYHLSPFALYLVLTFIQAYSPEVSRLKVEAARLAVTGGFAS